MAADRSSTEPAYSKHFIPLESNPIIFTELMHKLGVARNLCFEDVLSLDDADLLALLPRPAYALILVLPTTSSYEKQVAEEEARLELFEGAGQDEDVVFLKQTINNACGLYAILHAVFNGGARAKIEHGSLLGKLLQDIGLVGSAEVAAVLEGSKALEQVYAEVARQGDTAAPDNAEDEVNYHYVCLVASHKSGHLLQLDGDRKGPVVRGSLAAGEDLLAAPCLDVVRGIMASEGGNPYFHLMALVEGRGM